MAGAKFQLEDLVNPPEKVRLMFQAVIDLIAVNTDISGLKVQDITEKAGIGKGTAYEYFSSKEELIAMAMIYDCKYRLEGLQELVDQKISFAEMMEALMDWIHDKRGYLISFLRVIRMITGDHLPCDTVQEEIPADIRKQMHDYLLENSDRILEQGYREGVFTETDPIKRRTAFASMLVQVSMTLWDKTEDSFFAMDYGEAKQYAYQTLVKTLS